MRLTKLRHNSHTVVEARRFGADAVHNEWQKWTNDFAERWVASRHRAAFHCLSSHLLMCRSSASLRPCIPSVSGILRCCRTTQCTSSGELAIPAPCGLDFDGVKPSKSHHGVLVVIVHKTNVRELWLVMSVLGVLYIRLI